MATTSGLNAHSKLKLLFILDEFPDPHAGTEGQFLLLYSLLDRSKVAPAILLLRPSAFLQSHITDAPVNVLDVRRLRSVSALWRVFRAALRARRDGFEVAHIFFNDSALVFPLPLKLCGLKVVVSRRDLGFWYTRGNLPVLRIAAKFADAVVANSAAVKEVVIAREGFARDVVVVIHNGLRRDTQDGAAPVNSELSQDARWVVCVANLRPLKRFTDLIVALPKIRSAAGDIRLAIVGEDRPNGAHASHRAELEMLATRLGVAGYVCFLGKMPDPMPVIARASVCVLCSESEGLSNVLLEYMMAGKPVVCTAVGGNVELVIEGQTGYLIQVGDIETLASRVVGLLQNPALALTLGENAKVRAQERFSSGAMVREHQNLYDSLRKAR